jgi:hypothetical protein
MEKQEIRAELLAIRPNKPQKTAGRRTQQAIDGALEIMDKYDDLLRLITEAKKRGEL